MESDEQVPQIPPTTHQFGVLNISDLHIVVDVYKFDRRDAIKCSETIVVHTLQRPLLPWTLVAHQFQTKVLNSLWCD